MKKLALISVSDRSGLEDFARTLSQCGYGLLATTGSAKFLQEAGIETISIEDYTGQKEILDGRVKTLHPKIHAGLLAKRDNSAHMAQLSQEGILPIDIAIVNLYPFVQNLQSANSSDPKKMVELIDIGGPTMIRAAAKNFMSVLPLLDPNDYPRISGLLKAEGEVPLNIRLELATKVFSWLANYNLEISKYIGNVSSAEKVLSFAANDISAAVNGLVLKRAQELRYGENPHQKAAFYQSIGSENTSWTQLNGKELSYNNLLDFDAAFRLIASFKDKHPTVAILKHLNPCGAASASTLLEALRKSKEGDPRSHFGGVLAFNQKVEKEVAEAVAEDFAEIVVAPDYSAEAVSVFQKKKNLRVIKINLSESSQIEFRSVQGGFLVQQIDPGVSAVENGEVVSARKLQNKEIEDLNFAWKICAHIKSNAISIVKDSMLLAAGAGQMSRIDSVEVALMKAKTHKHNLQGAVAASDAFFPFPDCLETLAGQGVTAIVAPSGAKKDSEVIATADRLGISLVFVPDRHFRH